jgi:putative ABC transport system permease protein
LNVKLLAGRNFSRDVATDRGNEGRRAVLLNEAACKLLGFKTPESAIHNHISTYWGADYEIIGVLNSFHQLSLKEELAPMYFILQPRALSYFAINFNNVSVDEAISDIKRHGANIFPNIRSPFISWMNISIANISMNKNSAACCLSSRD